MEKYSFSWSRTLKFDYNMSRTTGTFNEDLCAFVIVKLKHSHYRPMGPRWFWEVKASRFRDIGT
jgi:hypothetical protein